MALTKAELVDLVCNKAGIYRRDARGLVDSFFEEIRAVLENGESVKLSGFGNFELIDKGQRPGRNPKTGVEAVIAPRRVVTFHPSPRLIDQVAKGDAQVWSREDEVGE